MTEYRVLNDVEFMIRKSELLDRDRKNKTIKRAHLNELVRKEFGGYHDGEDGGCVLVADLPELFERLGLYVE